MVKPITKYAKTIINPIEVVYEINKAIEIAKQGRPGPVLIDIPVDVQGMIIDEEQLSLWQGIKNNEVDIEEDVICEVIDIINKSKQPICLVGGGVSECQAKDYLRKLIEEQSLPTVCSLQGLDVINHENEAFIGYIGSYGNRYANIALQNSDCILVLGSRLDKRQTGKNVSAFAPKATIIHVEIDDSEIGHIFQDEKGIKCDVNKFIEKLFLHRESLNIDKDWLNTISGWKKYLGESQPANEIIKAVSNNINDKCICTFDVGQNQMWAAQSLRIAGRDVRILNSGGLGAMGYSLPASIGAYYADSEKDIYAFMGDGGIQMNIQELAVIGSNQLPVKIFVFNNKSLGLIREMHEKYYNNNCVGSVKGFSQPDFKMLAGAYGISYYEVKSVEDVIELRDKIRNNEPCLFDIVFNDNTYVRPELLGMDTLDKQSPYITEDDWRSDDYVRKNGKIS